MLRTAPIMLFYAGRRTPQEAAALFRPLFDGLERDPVSPPPTVVRRSAETVREVTESMDVTQGKLVIGMRTGITASDPDYPALVLLNSVYGSGVTSKLFVNVREKRSLCYYASSAVEKFKGLMIVSSGISFDQYETARDAILAELDALPPRRDHTGGAGIRPPLADLRRPRPGWTRPPRSTTGISACPSSRATTPRPCCRSSPP